MTITRTDLSRVGAMRAFPKLSVAGALPLGQTVCSIIASLPTAPGGCDAFILSDSGAAVSVVLSHDKARGETVVVLFEKSHGDARHAAVDLLRAAWRAGMVPAQPRVVAVAGSLEYAQAIGRMEAGCSPPATGMGGQHFVTLDLNTVGV
jgi:hypothetical protein